MAKKKDTKKIRAPKGQMSSDTMVRWLYLKDKTLNGVLCLGCGAVLVSHTRHDFVPCFCENETYVDGGQSEYMRTGGVDLSKIVTVKVTVQRGETK